MAGTSAPGRAVIAASFAAQAAMLLAAAAVLAGHPASPAAGPPVFRPQPTLPAPQVPLPKPVAPQLGPAIMVTVTAAGVQGQTDYPSPVAPVLWVPSGPGLVVTVTLTIPPGSQLGSFRLGMTGGAWTGVPDNGTALVTSGKLGSGQYTYTLHLTAADLPAENNYLVLTGQADGDSALTAQLADLLVPSR